MADEGGQEGSGRVPDVQVSFDLEQLDVDVRVYLQQLNAQARERVERKIEQAVREELVKLTKESAESKSPHVGNDYYAENELPDSPGEQQRRWEREREQAGWDTMPPPR
jgi:hypothetical protein